MLKKIVLHNYRLHSDYTYEFEQMNMISGRNGTGKTTLVEAIGFALFGSTMQRGKASSWVKRGRTKGGVELYIDDYIITRTTTLATVTTTDGKVIAKNNQGISEWVWRTYGLTPDLYRSSFYIGQKDIDSFAALTPLERTKRVERLLRIDLLEDLKNQAKDIASTTNARFQTYKGQLDGVEFSDDRIAYLETLLLEKQNEYGLLKEQIEKLLVESGEWASKQMLWQKREVALKSFAGIVYDLEALAEEHKKVAEYNAQCKAQEELIREKQGLEKKLVHANVQEDHFKYETSQILDHKRALLRVKTLESDLKALPGAKVINKLHDIESLASKFNEAKKHKDLCYSTPKVCPTCGQDWPKPITDSEKEAADKKVDELASKLSQARLDNEAFGILNELQEQRKLLGLELSVEQCDEILSSLRFRADYSRLQQLLNIPDEAQEPLQIPTAYAVASAQNAYAETIKETEGIEKPGPNPIDKINARKQEAVMLERVIADTTDQLRTQKGNKALHEKYSDLMEKEEVKLYELKRFIKFIDLYRRSFSANVIPLLEENVSKIASYLSEGKYTKITINNDYSIKDFDFFSGSEQDSVSFALRLSLAQISRLGSFKTMVFDEVAASFDAEKEKLLLDVLKQQGNQLVYITHGLV